MSTENLLKVRGIFYYMLGVQICAKIARHKIKTLPKGIMSVLSGAWRIYVVGRVITVYLHIYYIGIPT